MEEVIPSTEQKSAKYTYDSIQGKNSNFSGKRIRNECNGKIQSTLIPFFKKIKRESIPSRNEKLSGKNFEFPEVSNYLAQNSSQKSMCAHVPVLSNLESKFSSSYSSNSLSNYQKTKNPYFTSVESGESSSINPTTPILDSTQFSQIVQHRSSLKTCPDPFDSLIPGTLNSKHSDSHISFRSINTEPYNLSSTSHTQTTDLEIKDTIDDVSPRINGNNLPQSIIFNGSVFPEEISNKDSSSSIPFKKIEEHKEVRRNLLELIESSPILEIKRSNFDSIKNILIKHPSDFNPKEIPISALSRIYESIVIKKDTQASSFSKSIYPSVSENTYSNSINHSSKKEAEIPTHTPIMEIENHTYGTDNFSLNENSYSSFKNIARNANKNITTNIKPASKYECPDFLRASKFVGSNLPSEFSESSKSRSCFIQTHDLSDPDSRTVASKDIHPGYNRIRDDESLTNTKYFPDLSISISRQPKNPSLPLHPPIKDTKHGFMLSIPERMKGINPTHKINSSNPGDFNNGGLFGNSDPLHNPERKRSLSQTHLSSDNLFALDQKKTDYPKESPSFPVRESIHFHRASLVNERFNDGTQSLFNGNKVDSKELKNSCSKTHNLLKVCDTDFNLSSVVDFSDKPKIGIKDKIPLLELYEKLLLPNTFLKHKNNHTIQSQTKKPERYKKSDYRKKLGNILEKMRKNDYSDKEFDNYNQFLYYNFLTMSVINGCTWSAIEKQRLFDGIIKYGFDLNSIQKFIGSSKTVSHVSHYLNELEKGYMVTLAESPHLLIPPPEQFSIESTFEEIDIEEIRSIEEAEHEDLEYNNTDDIYEINKFKVSINGNDALEFFNSDRAYKILKYVHGYDQRLIIKSTWKELYNQLELFLRRIVSTIALNNENTDPEKKSKISCETVYETLDLMGIESSLQTYFSRIIEENKLTESELENILYNDKSDDIS
ncbi:hypothetical protein AYI68_g1949 [Smittium mucronatum]|uniref:Uncharacterized protein n=1 Tax=Smittium mucronatum TaxID=133383 RepID=A0A1R0H3Z6_9FUNG|nr:hypothetical protein AYI68_g1949 [Smittium mucronatum]